MWSAAIKISLLSILLGTVSSGQTSDEALIYFYSKPTGPWRQELPPGEGDRRVDFYGQKIRPLSVTLRRKAWLKTYIENGLKEDLRNFLLSDQWKGLRSVSSGSLFPLSEILTNDLVNDLDESVYRLESRCVERTIDSATGKLRNANPREATTGYSRGLDVCFDASKILKSNEDWNETWVRGHMMGLTLHEHLHHFGYPDADNRIHRLFQGYSLLWLSRSLPAPEKKSVSSEFLKLREAYRNGTLPEISDRPTRMQCDGHLRNDALGPDARLEILPVLKSWMNSDLILIPGMVNDSTLVVQSDFAPSSTHHVPTKVGIWNLGSGSAWVLNDLSSFKGGEVLGDVVKARFALSFIGRSPEPHRVVFEVVYSQSDEQASFIPSALTYEWNALGYLDCRLSEI